jgi:hypothetical protein
MSAFSRSASTTEQRAANFAYFFVLLYVPVAIGAFNGSKKIKE